MILVRATYVPLACLFGGSLVMMGTPFGSFEASLGLAWGCFFSSMRIWCFTEYSSSLWTIFVLVCIPFLLFELETPLVGWNLAWLPFLFYILLADPIKVDGSSSLVRNGFVGIVVLSFLEAFKPHLLVGGCIVVAIVCDVERALYHDMDYSKLRGFFVCSHAQSHVSSIEVKCSPMEV
ncbi:hypothetical protein SUGI_1014500 [Cryptomeria japonica]|nr:hypothetical protein SUGI_1014500 [Cryptomeria japonica]